MVQQVSRFLDDVKKKFEQKNVRHYPDCRRPSLFVQSSSNLPIGFLAVHILSPQLGVAKIKTKERFEGVSICQCATKLHER